MMSFVLIDTELINPQASIPKTLKTRSDRGPHQLAASTRATNFQGVPTVVLQMANSNIRVSIKSACKAARKALPGEMWLRGQNLSRDCASNPEANAKSHPEEGWYDTGDVCRIDEQGFLYIISRTKDPINYKGFRVSPTELDLHVDSYLLVAEGGTGTL
ncbi:hypothetical protein QQZ08_002073 [Neonectria magnoliae]|uniref:AMP-dependent synthetase/ligase domain-containing protein n=1 Tax=Neonectria magnoliae TaxID=2732573 RepID=A0ABR1IEB5_9HYPO